MQSKQDQLQAHLYVLGRVVSALTRGEPDAAETPMRRFTGAAVGGGVLALVLAAGAAVLGLVLPASGTAWQTSDTLVVEKETGTRYLLVDGVLHPVLNYTSARLLTGSQLQVKSVAQRALAVVPRGVPLGIPGAPDSLPQPGPDTGRQWTLCADPASGQAGTPVRTTVALDNVRPIGAPLGAGALLLEGPDGALYLAWHDHRLRVPDRAVLVALGYGGHQPWRVPAQWLAVLPSGPDLRAPAVPGRGADGPRVGGRATKVGQVLSVTTTGDGGPGASYFLVLQDGLAPVSALEAALLLGDPGSRGAYPDGRVTAVAVSSSDAAALALSGHSVDAAGLPATTPVLVEAAYGRAQAPCVRLLFGPGGTAASAVVGLADVPSAVGGASGEGRALVAPGGGLLAEAPALSGDRRGAQYLVSDLGVKYPLGGDAASALGYNSNAPVAVPSALLDLLPTGPELSAAAAAREQLVTAPSTP
ncbi:type VII secretion protein EccB [Streptomyces sp. TLI_235]|nr:type VII secretion protein EccB [Streptomyces sp. TLI_235]PBC69616.1 type VII secretion protein EccB [Streptomyces sp. TLI_235]